MLDRSEIIRIVDEVARANLRPVTSVTEVLTEPATDSLGHEALRIIIVIKPGAAARFDGDDVLNTLVQIQDRLHAAGEERFPIVEYATKRELQNSGDPQF